MTFTLTQIADAYLWTLNNKQGEGGLQACTSYQMQFGSAPGGEIDYPNFVVSKYVIPLIVFSQHVRCCCHKYYERCSPVGVRKRSDGKVHTCVYVS